MPDDANISAINLKEILCRICHRARWLGQLASRRACLLAAQTPSEADISDADRATLRAIGDGREALDRLHKDARLTAITRRFRNDAADQIHREECDRLKCSSHRQTALQVARDTFLSAVAQVVSGFTKPTSEEYSDNLFARFCCWLLDDTGSAPWELERAAEILDTPDFRTELLNKLWKECPEEAKELHLPKPGGEQGGAAPRALQGRVELGRSEHGETPATPYGPANPLVELLVKLEQASRQRQSEIQGTATKRLLDDSKFRSEMLRSRFRDLKHATRKDLTFSASERRELRDFAGGKVGFPDLSASDKVHAAMILATGEVEKEVLQREREDYIERGGSFVDWHRHGDNAGRTLLLRSTQIGASCCGQRLYPAPRRPVARLPEQFRHVRQRPHGRFGARGGDVVDLNSSAAT